MPPRKKIVEEVEVVEDGVVEEERGTVATPAPRASGKPPMALKLAQEDLKKLNKGKEDTYVALDPTLLTQPFPHWKTGSFIADYYIGGKANERGIQPCPGIPKGRITLLYGVESSGKTTLALTVAAAVCKAGGTVCYIDYEQEVNLAWAKTLGVPVEDDHRFQLHQPDTLDEGAITALQMIKRGVSLVIFDSVGASQTKSERAKTLDDPQRVGANATFWNRVGDGMKNALNRSGTALLAISQIRSKIETGKAKGGDGMKPQGGNIWMHIPSVRIKLIKIGAMKEQVFNPFQNKTEEAAVGVLGKMKIEKCKVSQNMGFEGIYHLRSGYGFDNPTTVIELCSKYRVVRKDGSWYTVVGVDGEERRAQGMKGFREIVMKDAALYSFLEKKALEILSHQGASDIPAEPMVEDTVDEDMDSLMAELTSDGGLVIEGEAADSDDDGGVTEE